MFFNLKSTLVGALLSATAAQAACSANLLIDNFAKYSSNSNSLGSWTSDDQSMTSISASSNTLTFNPKSSSYFYETIPCQAASSNGYNALQFSVTGPKDASFLVELQSKTACSNTAYNSAWFTVSGLTGSKQTITIPLSSFSGASLNGITGFVWSTFSKTGSQYQLSNVNLVCSSGGGGTPTTLSTTKAPTPTPTPTGTCTNLVVDDWESQSRLTFLYYNSLILPTSDDGTMSSIAVSNNNRVTFTPSGTDSYFYSKTGCVNTQNRYGGISLRIKAPAGTTFTIELSSPSTCGGDDTSFASQTTRDLGWTFDGTEKLYSIPFSKFSALDKTKVATIFFTAFTKAVTFGPMAFYCGNTVGEFVPPATTATAPSSTVPAPAGTAAALVIDQFGNQNANALGMWHGGDDGLSTTWGSQSLTLKADDSDYSFYTQVSATCKDMTMYDNSYLHVVYSGSNKFTIAMQQHNSQCNANIAPYPETWDSLEAARYSSATDIYIPIKHFNINRSRTVGFAFKGFYTTASTVLKKVEIVQSVPSGWKIPNKLPTGNLVFACKRPNSFAFAIDDGIPALSQEVMKIIKEENIKVTFFTVGAPLDDASTNLTNVYREMASQGHQIALHSYTHPKMEGLPDNEAIDWEYINDIEAMKDAFGANTKSNYFRPPFGNEGARMRQRLTQVLGTADTYIMNWSVDVEDWLWAETSTPEKQLDAFKRDVNKGGNLVVMHYLYPSTVSYLRQFIQIAKATGKQLMRVDQCMMDPNAPPL
ncbi:glycosyl hydrolase [Microdochium trichocladiopsis]|uniref:Glycosyl hydrolase n=1 Tax=Microdochium trichocladiopsis TaxID=1682393 RepID=A0A9P8Y1X0_9PEZI|nr:glycosyl hydrolase [Microdochium trichocladiopsis]KAH7027349.1 glycosyl hydrolase [Microdochium trichocladiopsis]